MSPLSCFKRQELLLTLHYITTHLTAPLQMEHSEIQPPWETLPHHTPITQIVEGCRERKLNITFRKKEGCGFIAEQKLNIKRERQRESMY